jgi:carbon-monoxide dehydrogenase medium subunit
MTFSEMQGHTQVQKALTPEQIVDVAGGARRRGRWVSHPAPVASSMCGAYHGPALVRELVDKEEPLIVRDPKTLAELFGILASDEQPVRLLAGGTVVLPDLFEAVDRSGTLASLSALPLKDIAELADGGLELGAMVTIRQIETDPRIRSRLSELADVAKSFGTLSLRHLATLGGNLAIADPEGTLAPLLLSLGTRTVLATSTGERTLELDEYFASPARADSVLLRVVVPTTGSAGSAYVQMTRRKALDPPLAGVAVTVALDPAGERCVSCGIGLSALSPRPSRARSAEALVVGAVPNDALIDQVAEEVARSAEPSSDWRATADYRRHLARVLTQRAFRAALERARAA